MVMVAFSVGRARATCLGAIRDPIARTAAIREHGPVAARWRQEFSTCAGPFSQVPLSRGPRVEERTDAVRAVRRDGARRSESRPVRTTRRADARRPASPRWDEIVDRHSDRVYRLAYRLTGNRHDAEDLTQEVFVRVFRSLDTYTPGTFEGWIHRITTNLFLDQARRKQRIRFDALSDERAEPAAQRPARPRHGVRRPDLRRRHRAARSPRCRRSSARPSCCATSRASPTTRSPRSSTPSSAPSAPASTAAAPCCARALAHRAPADGTHPLPGPAPRGPAGPGIGRRDRAPRTPGQRAPRRPAVPADEERAWAHVHSCHPCRDAVEREGWVKTRLATMQFAGAAAPSHLKGSLLVRRRRWPGRPAAGCADSRRAGATSG